MWTDLLKSRAFLVGLAGLILSALLLLALSVTRLDWLMATTMYDAARHDFPLRHAWVAEVLVHRWIKLLMWLIGGILLTTVIRDVWRPLQRFDEFTRRRLRIVVACALTIPALVSLLKRLSASHCPWDIVDFGGTAPYVHLLSAMPDGVPPGHCFPAGHATSVLWLVSLCVFWLPRQPARAFLAGALALSAGVAVGLIQQLRGAHFLSHTLWSAWIACGGTFVLYQVLTYGEADRFRDRPTDRSTGRFTHDT